MVESWLTFVYPRVFFPFCKGVNQTETEYTLHEIEVKQNMFSFKLFFRKWLEKAVYIYILDLIHHQEGRWS